MVHSYSFVVNGYLWYNNGATRIQETGRPEIQAYIRDVIRSVIFRNCPRTCADNCIRPRTRQFVRDIGEGNQAGQGHDLTTVRSRGIENGPVVASRTGPAT